MATTTKEKLFFIREVRVNWNGGVQGTYLTCTPEEAAEFQKYIGKTVKIVSTIELVEETVDAEFEEGVPGSDMPKSDPSAKA